MLNQMGKSWWLTFAWVMGLMLSHNQVNRPWLWVGGWLDGNRNTYLLPALCLLHVHTWFLVFLFGGWLSSFVLQLNIKHFLLWKTSDVHTRKNGIMNTLCSAQCTHQASAVINVLPFWFHPSPTLMLLLEYFKVPQVFYHFILTEVRETLKITTVSLSYLVRAYILSCFSHV